jgi:hypothetical protein
MSEIKNVVILPQSTKLPIGLQEALNSKNLSSKVCSTLVEASDALNASDESVFLVYAGEDANLDSLTNTLTTKTELHTSPLIIVGENIDRYESLLNRFFILATTITLPCDNADIVSAVKYISRYLEKVRSRKVAEASTIVKSEFESYQKLFGGFSTIPNLAFAKLKELDLFEKDSGGETYALMFRPQESQDKSFLPKSPQIKQFIANITDSLATDRTSRAMRISLLSHNIFTALGFYGEYLECAKEAASLYSAGILKADKNLTQSQYLVGDKELLRKEICSGIKDSLLSFGDVISNERTRKIIILLAKLIGEEESLDNSSECLAASAIAIADAIDRVIYNRNVFQPVGAYSVLSVLKKQEFSFIHPLVLGITVKILAEAVSSSISVMNKSKKLQQVSQLLNAADEIDESIILGDTESIPLSKLEPGMRLTSKGINTEDGKVLISESMELDQDIIWRLWQLSAIRPLQKKVIVEKS